MAKVENIERIAELSPVQQGLLFHSLEAPGSGVYVVQLVAELAGELGEEAFAGAWQDVVDRHPGLRAAFFWKGLEKPAQIFQRQVPLPLTRHDWRGHSRSEQELAFTELTSRERRRGFELGKAPLLRLDLVRTGDKAWRFLLTHHHLILDGWSQSLVLGEVFAAYEVRRTASLRGTAGPEASPSSPANPPPSPRPRPYWEYIAWLQGRDTAAAEVFWRRELAGLTAPTPLPLPPASGPRPGVGQSRIGAPPRKSERNRAAAGEVILPLPLSLGIELGELARRLGLTRATFFQGAWALLLGRTQGSAPEGGASGGGGAEVVFGVTLAGRPPELPGAAGMVGLFINTLPLRLPVPQGSELAPWLGEVQRRQAEVGRFDFSPPSKVQGWSEVPRGTSLFDSILVFENYPVDPSLADAGKDLRVVAVHNVEQTHYDLTVVVQPGSNFLLRALYPEHRFDATAVRRLLRSLVTVLGQMVIHPEARLGEIPLLGSDERHQVLREWQDTALARGQDEACLPELIEAPAESVPERIALVSGDEHLSYRELAGRGQRLARWLRGRGVGRDGRVGVAMERSPELVVALHGIVRAGAAYLPLDPAYPRERLASMLEAGLLAAAPPAEPRKGSLATGRPRPILLTQSHLDLGFVPVGRVECLALDPGWGGPTRGVWAEPLPELPPDPLRDARPESLAYILFTSGSTGRPKGVMVPHRGIVNRLLWMQEAYGLTSSDRVLQKTPYSFDVSVWEFFWPFLAGATLVVARPGGHREPAYLVDLVARQRITTLHFVPSMLRVFLEEPDLAPRCQGLRRVIASGEALPPDLRDRFYQRAAPPGPCRAGLHNLYGPTEAAVDVTFHPCRDDGDRRTVPIGRPIANTVILLLDRRLAPVPVGMAGELFIGGVNLARGYAGRPALTASVFVPRPDPGFGGEARGERLYRTGDLARWLPEGSVEYLGRADFQVKIRGVRIELGEIEATLDAHEAVAQAVVTAREGAGGQRLVAYLVAAVADPPDPGALRTFLLSTLPEAMVPAVFVFLPAMPLTTSGKVDRKALPEPEADRPGLAAPYRAPRNPTEEILVRLWQQVLGLERVGVEDDFFALGGDSILSIQIAGRAAREGLTIDPGSLFQHSTIAALAGQLATREVLGKGKEEGEGRREEPSGALIPLTPPQRWFLDADPPVPEHFNLGVLTVLARPLPPAVVARAVEALLRHHDALGLRFTRTGYRGSRGGWQQSWVAPEGAPSFACLDLGALGSAHREKVRLAASARLQTRLDLQAGPVLAVLHFRYGAGETEHLLFTAHHLVVDGVSWRILLEDFTTACEQLEAEEAVVLPAKTAHYGEWARALETAADRPEWADQEEYWRQVACVPVARLSTGGAAARQAGLESGAAAPWGLEGSSETVRVEVGPAATEALLGLVHQGGVHGAYGTRIDDLLLAALALALARWSGEERFLVDLEGHGRDDGILASGELNRTVGWFTAIYPVLLEAPPGVAPGELILGVKETLTRVPGRGRGHGLLRDRHTGAPGRQAGEVAGGSRAEVLFNYLGRLDVALPAGSLLQPQAGGTGPLVAAGNPRHHLLEVNATVTGGRLRVHWSYSRECHKEAGIEALAEVYVEALEELVDHCRAVVSTPAAAVPVAASRPIAGRFIPSDFPLAGLDPEGLNGLLALLPPEPRSRVETLYPLSPAQQGMYFFYLLNQAQEGLFVNLVTWTLRGPLETEALGQAWGRVLDLHETLRTLILGEGQERPFQVVLRGSGQQEGRWQEAWWREAWRQEDWRQYEPAEQQKRFAALLAAERRRGFDLSRPPLFRLTLLRTGEAGWRVVWTYNQLLLDGWSLGLVLKDLFQAWRALSRGEEPQLEAPRPYRDYIAWLAGRDAGASEAFWRQHLEGFDHPTSLGISGGTAHFEDEVAEGGRVEERQRTLPEHLAEALSAFARGHRLTLNTVMAGAWALLLHRYSAERDVVFGSVVSGRPAELSGFETMVGLFINALPLRSRLPKPSEGKTAPLLAWLGALQEQQLEIRRHEHVPLEQVQRWSEVPWEHPLFETLLIFENYPVDQALLAGARRAGDGVGDDVGSDVVVTDVAAHEQTNYPLNLFVLPGPPMRLLLTFDRHRFDGQDMERLLIHVETLLGGMVAAPGRAVRDLSLMRRGEREEILAASRGTAAAYPEGAIMPALFEARAALHPERVAVVHGETVLTYGELHRRAGLLARHLGQLGAGPEGVVVLFVEPVPEMVIGLLGIARSGASYLPLDPALPERQLRFILDDARASVILVHGSTRGALPAGVGAVVDLDELAFGAPGALAAGDPPVCRATAANRLYIIYTSGSSGKPKGVEVPHRCLVHYTTDAIRAYGLSEEDRLLQFASISFDASAEEIYPCLLTGATLVLRNRGRAGSVAAFMEECIRHRITVLDFPTAYWHEAITRMIRDGINLPPSLRLTIIGGEEALASRLEEWQRITPPEVELINTYGPTEATIVALRERLLKGFHGRRVTIGQPLSNVHSYILDRDFELLPPGVPGELLLGGAGLARGYLRRPALTAERFVPDPFSSHLGERLYRTGDLCRFLSPFNVEFLGRMDTQIKLRGFRVELGAIEATLVGHPEVREAVVILDRPREGEGRLVAYAVAGRPQEPPAREVLQAFLREHLPEYMVPAVFVFLPEFPFTPLGKVNRRALPPPKTVSQAMEPAWEAPRNEVEEALAEAFAEVLGRERVGIYDNFFDLGGHSLLATRLVSRIRRLFEVEIPLRIFFEAPSVARLGLRIEEMIIEELEELSDEELAEFDA